MLYLFDFCFVIGYLIIRRVFRKMHDVSEDIFLSMRGIIGWCEFAYVMLFVFFLMPLHTVNEGAVAFVLSMATKLVFQLATVKKFKT